MPAAWLQNLRAQIYASRTSGVLYLALLSAAQLDSPIFFLSLGQWIYYRTWVN